MSRGVRKDTMARLWMLLAWMPLAITLPQVSRTRRGFVLGLCTLSALLATVTLVGWTFDRVELARWVVELPTMKPNTAISVLALCLALVPLGLALPDRAARVLAWAPLAAVGLMGATVFEHMTLVDLGIDQWLLADRSTPAAAFPGRTAAAAALALGMLGLALLPGPTLLRRSRLAASMVAFVIGYVASVGLLLEVRWSVGVGIAFAELSLPTAACIVMLGASTLSLLQWQAADRRSQDAPVSAGARFLRGALPVAMVLPAAVMWLQHIANQRGWWDTSVGMVAAVALLALVLWALVVGCARWIDGLEAELRKSQTLLEQRVSERTADLVDSAARLRASQAQLAGVVESASTAIIALDADFRIITFNHEAERVFGVSAREMLGRTLDRLLPPRSRPGHTQALQRFARTGDTVRRMGGEAQLHGLRADGTEFPIAASISRVALPQGALFTVVLRDLTEALALQAERTAREAAEMANRSKSQLLSHVSHELRTPLNAVLGFAQLLRQDMERHPGAGGRIDFLDHIESASRQLDRLIADLLDLSRAEVGALAFRLRPVDAAGLLREAMVMIEPQAQQQCIELVAAAADGPTMVMADERRLLQVMTNLLSNAVKYTAPGGSTRIALRDDGVQVALDVVDSGVGMSDDQLAHLFEPFNRLGRENGTVPGSGIGLALSRQLVLAMDGRIEVASRPGQGSRFTVRLSSAASHMAPPLPPLLAPASVDPAAPDSAAE